MNNVILLGRLTKTPEKKYINNRSVINIVIAVRRKYQNNGEHETDFISCEAWGHNADFICKYFKKGDNICINGEIRTDSYTKDGKKKYVTKILVNSVYFTGSKIAESR